MVENIVRINSPFPYPGTKFKLLPRLIELFPDHAHFVDVFGGTGSAILSKPRSRIESFNDRSRHIYNFFKVCRDDIDELKRRCEATPARCFETFREAQEILRTTDTPVKSAWAWLVLYHQGHITSDQNRLSPGNWSFFREPYGGRIKWDRISQTLDMVRKRFQKVQLWNCDALKLIEKLDGIETFFFLDPPYLDIPDLYENTMDRKGHIDLLQMMKNIHGKAMIVSYANDVYDDELSKWHRIEIPAKCQMAHWTSKLPRIECIWTNFLN